MCNFHELEEVLKEPSLKIYDSHTWVNHKIQTTPYYKLRQLSMWDLRKADCHKIGDKSVFSYILQKVVPLNTEGYCKVERVELTDEMKQVLIKMGYTIK